MGPRLYNVYRADEDFPLTSVFLQWRFNDEEIKRAVGVSIRIPPGSEIEILSRDYIMIKERVSGKLLFEVCEVRTPELML